MNRNKHFPTVLKFASSNVCCEECVSFCCSISVVTASVQMCWKMLFPREARVIFILGKIRHL